MMINMKRKGIISLFIMLSLANGIVTAQDVLQISVQADKSGAEIQPAMWGVFFEDINFAADGGISTDQARSVALTLGPLPYTKTAVKKTLKSDSKDDFNSIANPKAIYPVSTPVKIAGRKINAEAEPLSVSIFIIEFKAR